MKKKLLLSKLLLILYSAVLNAQSNEIYEIKSQQGESIAPNDICYAGGNSFLIAGANGITPFTKGILTKIDLSGNILQSLSIDSLNFRKVIHTSDNSFLILYATPNYYNNKYLMKTDSDLNVIWAQQLPVNMNDLTEINGRYYVFGLIAATDLSYQYSHYILKFDLSGTLLNQAIFCDSTQNIFGDYKYSHWSDALTLAGDGNLMLAGRTRQASGSGVYSLTICKMDTLLNVIWYKKLNCFYQNFPSEIKSLSDGNLLITGTFNFTSLTSSYGLGLIKIDTNGNILFCRIKKYPAYALDTRSFDELPDRSLFFGGTMHDSSNFVLPFTLGTDSLGNTLFASGFNFTNLFHQFYKFFTTPVNNTFALYGQLYNTTNDTSNCAFIVTDFNAQSCISSSFATTDSVISPSIAGIGITYLSILSLPSPLAIPATAIYPVITEKYCNPTSGHNLNNMNSTALAFPNPCFNILNVHVAIENDLQKDIRIYSLPGDLKISFATREPKVNIDISSLPEGIYILEIKDGNSISRQKFIKQ